LQRAFVVLEALRDGVTAGLVPKRGLPSERQDSPKSGIPPPAEVLGRPRRGPL